MSDLKEQKPVAAEPVVDLDPAAAAKKAAKEAKNEEKRLAKQAKFLAKQAKVYIYIKLFFIFRKERVIDSLLQIDEAKKTETANPEKKKKKVVKAEPAPVFVNKTPKGEKKGKNKKRKKKKCQKF